MGLWGAHLGSLQLQLSLALGFTPRRLLVLLQGQVGIRRSTSVGIGWTLKERRGGAESLSAAGPTRGPCPETPATTGNLLLLWFLSKWNQQQQDAWKTLSYLSQKKLCSYVIHRFRHIDIFGFWVFFFLSPFGHFLNQILKFLSNATTYPFSHACHHLYITSHTSRLVKSIKPHFISFYSTPSASCSSLMAAVPAGRRAAKTLHTADRSTHITAKYSSRTTSSFFSPCTFFPLLLFPSSLPPSFLCFPSP